MSESEAVALAIVNLETTQELWQALNVAMGHIDAEHNLTKALLIKMRRYILSHGLLIGECVAWNQLKQRYGVGQSNAADDQWLAAYQATTTGARDDRDQNILSGAADPG